MCHESESEQSEETRMAHAPDRRDIMKHVRAQQPLTESGRDNSFRVVGPDGIDSGWLPAGRWIHDAVKNHVRKWHGGRQDCHWVVKEHDSHSAVENGGTGAPDGIIDNPFRTVLPVWHAQPAYAGEYELPADLAAFLSDAPLGSQRTGGGHLRRLVGSAIGL
jgi:hypothetical protein